MKNQLPKLVDSYIRASNQTDVKAYVSCFTDTATVSDDGETVTGRHAIGDWFAETQKKYDSTTEAIEVKESADKIVLTAKVSGTFPGSPLKFDYHMRLKSGLIDNLRIEFRK